MRYLQPILLALIVLSIPLLLVTTSIRLALSPVYIQLEYRMPGFPPDSYGFTMADRLQWAQVSIDYLLGRIPHQAFSQLQLSDGGPLFNQRELDHMLDVRILTAWAMQVWWVCLILNALAIGLAFRFNFVQRWLGAVRAGSALTILFIVGTLLYVALDFNRLFTQFHMIFFEGDSWLFLPNDNLIRLFPLRFWQDLFIFLGVTNLASVALLFLLSSSRLRKMPS